MRRIELGTALFSARRWRFRFYLSTRLRRHDREKDFDYPRYLLMHTRPGRRSLFGAEFGTADRCLCCDDTHARRTDARLRPSCYPLQPWPCNKLGSRGEGRPSHKWPKGRRLLGYYTAREDHRTGFHCCQTLCHTVIDDLDREEARKHGMLWEETRFLSLLTKDCITTPPVTKLKDTQSWFFFLFLCSFLAALLYSTHFLTSESRIIVFFLHFVSASCPGGANFASCFYLNWNERNGGSYQTDAQYCLPGSDDQGQRNRPVNLYARLFPQHQSSIFRVVASLSLFPTP